MKKLTAVLLFAVLLTVPLSAAAEETTTAPATPVLTDIAFKNAVIVEPFSPSGNEYTLTLEDPTKTPTLKSYTVEGDAELFVTETVGEAKHKTGLKVVLEYTGGTTVYSFTYANAEAYSDSANNYLASVTCQYGEVYPAINENQTDYTLYIASDLTTLELKPVTEDVGAYCELSPQIALSADQELPISATVIAANGDTRTYTFKIKRLKKTCAEVQEAMASPDFETLAEGELFYQKPVFWITVGAVGGGLLLLLLFSWIAKRLTVNTQDGQEEPFFAGEELPEATEKAEATEVQAEAEEAAPSEEAAGEETPEAEEND